MTSPFQYDPNLEKNCPHKKTPKHRGHMRAVQIQGWAPSTYNKLEQISSFQVRKQQFDESRSCKTGIYWVFKRDETKFFKCFFWSN